MNALSYRPYSKFDLRVVMICAMAGTLMQGIDSTIANVALPYMQGSLAASRDQITWVLTSYIVSAAVMTTPVGWLASRYGRKRFLILSIVGFTLTSMLCGAAQTLEQMIFFRFLQGCFGASLSPLAQSIMFDLYPPQKRGSVMAIWGIGVMVGPILGPTLGGYLTEMYDWRWVFYVNLPIGIASVTGLWLFFRDTRHDTSLKFDWFGFALLASGIASLQLMLDRGTTKDWFSSPEILIEALVAGLGIYLFVVHLLMGKGTFIQAEVFKDRNFLSAMALMFVLGMITLASSALLPPYLQNLGGYSVTDTGLLMAPRGIGTMVAMVAAGQMAMRVDARLIMAIGIALLAWSLFQMSQWMPNVPWQWLALTTVIQGIGMGLVFVPMSLVAFATLAAKLRTDGSALINLIRNIGAAMGVSVTTTILANGIQIAHAQLAQHANPFNRALGVNAPSMDWNLGLPAGAAQIDGVIQTNAQLIAYADDFFFMFLLSLAGLVVVALIKRPDMVIPSHSSHSQYEMME
jgi:DHA2 family multidrug resistance protein